MSDTSFSLLNRLRLQPDAESWRRLVELYTPLIQGWLRRYGGGVQPHDLDDLVQEVLGQVVGLAMRLDDLRTGQFEQFSPEPRAPRPGALPSRPS